MAILQQIILDSIPGTPGSNITRDQANRGLVVKYADDQSGRNKSAYGSPVFELTAAQVYPSDPTALIQSDKPAGVIGDYHNHRQFTLITRGRVKLESNGRPHETHVGKRAIAAEDGRVTFEQPPSGGNIPNVDHGGSDPTKAFGEIIGVEGGYWIVDINFPEM